MTKRALLRRKVYRWRIDRIKTRAEIYKGVTLKSLRHIDVETFTLGPKYLAVYFFEKPKQLHKEQRKKMKQLRKAGKVWDGTPRK